MGGVSCTWAGLEPGSDGLARVGEDTVVVLVVSSEEVADLAELATVGIDGRDDVWARVGRARNLEGGDRGGRWGNNRYLVGMVDSER